MVGACSNHINLEELYARLDNAPTEIITILCYSSFMKLISVPKTVKDLNLKNNLNLIIASPTYGNCKKVNHSSLLHLLCHTICNFKTFISLRAIVLPIYKIQCIFIIYLWFIYCDSTLFKTIKLYRCNYIAYIVLLFYVQMSFSIR